MRAKIFLIFLSSLVFAFAASSRVFSQEEFNFDRALADYVFSLDIYQKEHSEYLLARSQFLQAGTLAAQTKAIDETRGMLIARDDALTTYLTALRLRLIESEGIETNAKETIFARLDAEVSWFKDHKERVKSASSLSDLTTDSDEARDHFTSFTEGIVFEVLSIIPAGKISSLREGLTEIINSAEEKTSSIRAKGDHDTSVVERWLSQTDNTLTRSLDKELEASEIILIIQSGLDERGRAQLNNKSQHERALSLSEESLQFLKDANGFLKEVVNSIRTKS